MVVYGNFNELKDFRNKLVQAREEGEKLSEWNTYVLYKLFGYSSSEEIDHNGYIRGTIYDISTFKYNEELNQFYIIVGYETAWSPMIEGFDYLLKTHYKNLQALTIAEEPGCDIYINEDINHYFFKTQYCLDIFDNNVYYCDNDNDLIDTFNRVCNQKVDSVKGIIQYLNRNEDFASLHEYTSN